MPFIEKSLKLSPKYQENILKGALYAVYRKGVVRMTLKCDKLSGVCLQRRNSEKYLVIVLYTIYREGVVKEWLKHDKIFGGVLYEESLVKRL